MKVETLALRGALLLEPRVFEDARGYFLETWNERTFLEAGVGPRFVQDNQSGSRRGVLRGLHAQLARPQGKLVRAVGGAVFDVAVDLRVDSPTFGRWIGVELSATNRRQLWIPPGFAHGFCTLSDFAELAYKCTRPYDPTDEIGVRWNDPEVDIEWPLESPRLSDKDSALPTLAEVRHRLEAAPEYRMAPSTAR